MPKRPGRRFHIEKRKKDTTVSLIEESSLGRKHIGSAAFASGLPLLRQSIKDMFKGKKLAKLRLGLEEEYQTEPYKRRGLGTRMAHTLEALAREKGVQVLIAFITPSNKASIKFFKKLGYTNIKGSHYYFKEL